MTNSSDQVAQAIKGMGVQMAYGEKVELGASTIVPVAIVGFGAGAGEGEGDGVKGTPSTGSGAGGGGASVPIGAYVSDEFGTRFQPNIIALFVTLLPLVTVVGWALPKLIKALKR